MSTLADYTTDQIRDALLAAIAAHDMPAAASLLCAYATRDPHGAALIAAAVKAAAEGRISIDDTTDPPTINVRISP